MSKLITKARAGVTLVELLVVVLIVTILSVSLLPLLKPFVVESQYAAEAIPVIGNLRTKIGVYQYDKGKLPAITTEANATYTTTDHIETWGFSVNGTTTQDGETDAFAPCTRPLNAGVAGNRADIGAAANRLKHFGALLEVDNQELVGKRCKPVHFQYVCITNGATYVYALGCFGDNHGLPVGTGYAVCEINVVLNGGLTYKQIGTWKRYKATTDGQITFAKADGVYAYDAVPQKNLPYCAIPSLTHVQGATDNSKGELNIVKTMESYGWEF